jgi:uncharacterized membrane protein YqiK
MSTQPILIVGAAIACGALLLLCFAFMVTRFYRKVEQGKALIVNTTRREPDVTFTGRIVLPIIHKAEVMDISVKTIEIDRRGKEGLICKDNIRADIKVSFYVRVNKTDRDVLSVAQMIGCARASDETTLEQLFSAKFSEALKTVGKQLEFTDLYTQRDEFRDQIIELIGRDLYGYVLESASIDFLEQTPLSHLDAQNILDAQGIRKITELTAIESIRTNEYENNKAKQIKKQDVEAREAILELERQQADAEAKQSREIMTVRAREQAETRRVEQEERLKAERARIQSDEAIAVAEQNQQREVAVAQKSRERVVAVETERVEKARALEAVDRERETQLRSIDAEKAVEAEKCEIANVIRERIAVEKTVAEQEEAIKTLRVVQEAERGREAVVIAARAEAEKGLVRDVKAAEAAEEAARFRAREEITLAEARFEAAERDAKAKVRLAQGHQAEMAAPGLAEVEVKQADAVAIEKLGMAEIRVREASATAVERMGQAEAAALEQRYLAEARGIREKAQSMREFDERSRSHEEYRLEIDKAKTLGLESIAANVRVAEAQARLVQEGLKGAKIDIVGGESVFFDRLVGSLANAKAVDGFCRESQTASKVMKEYEDSRNSLRQDILDVLRNPSVSTADLQNLTVSAFLRQVMQQSQPDSKEKILRLLQMVDGLGLSETRLQ